MRQSLVNRSVWALCGLFVAACISFALVVDSGPRDASGTAQTRGVIPEMATVDVSVGANLYAARCERCHDLDEALLPLREAEPGADARAEYLELLQWHRKSSADEHAPIIDYLQRQLTADDAAAGTSSRPQ